MTTREQQEQALRQAFKLFNPAMIWMWRLGLGKPLNAWPAVLGRYIVIRHTGRRSGRVYYQPLNYAQIDGDIYCTAGFGPVSDWYQNILADPHVEVWMAAGWWAGLAEDVSDDANRLGLLREVLIGSGFAAYAAGLDPRNMSDLALSARTGHYRLLRIRRTEARTGPGGPGENAWVWPLATLLLAALLLLRPRRR